MDNDAFLAQVEALLRDLVQQDVVVLAVQPVGGRPSLRTEVMFQFADPPASWRRPISGSAHVPLTEEWRYASGYEEPADYAQLAADAVEVGRVSARIPKAAFVAADVWPDRRAMGVAD